MFAVFLTEYVFSLDATDEFLKERARNFPQSIAEEMQYTQDEFLQRLSMFRDANMGEESVLDYFDELEIHPEHIGENSTNPIPKHLRHCTNCESKQNAMMWFQISIFYSELKIDGISNV